jgi:hypothetical protein
MLMAGKTGTSQVRIITAAERAAGVTKNEQLPWNRRDHALFVAYAPFDSPRYAIALIVEHGGGGSAAAAPIARDILLYALYGGLPPLEAYPAEQRSTIEEQRAAEPPATEPRERTHARTVDGELFEPEHGGEHRTQRHRCAQEIEAAGIWVPVLGEDPRPEDEKQGHHRQCHEKDRAPPEVLQKKAADHGADSATCGECGDPEANRPGALVRVWEHVEYQGEGGRGDGGTCDAHEGPTRDEPGWSRHEGGNHRDQPEGRSTYEQQTPSADPIAESAHRDQGPGNQEPVDVDDPQEFRAGGL